MPQDTIADPHSEQATRARYRLVQTLKQQGSLHQSAVEAAFLAIPRHLFLSTLYGREENAPLRWKQITPSAPNYKQLRLLFRPSRADEIRDWIDTFRQNMEENYYE